jgi:hypothetical protein
MGRPKWVLSVRRSLFSTGVEADNATAVLWFFQRGGARLRCEIRRALNRPGFELVWTGSDGQVRVEYSDDAAPLSGRRHELEDKLRRAGWKRVGRVTPPARV